MLLKKTHFLGVKKQMSDFKFRYVGLPVYHYGWSPFTFTTISELNANLAKHPAFHHPTTGFPRNTSWERLQKLHTPYSILHTDLGSSFDWLKQNRPIRSTTQIWVVTPHQCGISSVVSLTRGNQWWRLEMSAV